MLYNSPIAQDERMMLLALDEAAKAYEEGEVPVGAVISCGGKVIAKAHNLTERLKDVTAHAEMQAITAAADYLGGKYLQQCTLYVTLEPCPMCAAALRWSQIGRVVYGADDPRHGYRRAFRDPDDALHPKTIVEKGLMADDALEMMKSFFAQRR